MAAPAKFGPEFLVNTSFIGSQFGSVATALTNGTVVMTWANANGGAESIKGRLLTAAGVPLGPEFTVNQSFGAVEPAIAPLSDGRFVVGWKLFTSANVKARIYDHDGSPVGGEFDLSTPSSGYTDESVALAGLPGGGFVATWHHVLGDTVEDIEARAFNQAGLPLGPEFGVATGVAAQRQPTIAALSDDSYVIAWTDLETGIDTFGSHIAAAVYRGNGEPVAGAFTANTSFPGNQSDPAVAALPGGGFVLTWTHDRAVIGGTAHSIRGRLFTDLGIGQAPEFAIDAALNTIHDQSSVSGLQNGEFFVAWQDGGDATETDGSDSHVRGAILSGASAAPITGEFVVNTTVQSFQHSPSVTILRDGRVLVTWSDLSRVPPDTSGLGVRAQIFDPRTTGVSLSGSAFPDDWVATGFGDVLRGNGGPDRLNGLGGNDAVFGGIGNDILSGDAGNDRVSGDADHDVVLGGLGNDILSGGLGNDRVSGDAGNDRVLGDAGQDIVSGGVGADLVYGGLGNDRLIGGLGRDIETGGAGRDVFVFDDKDTGATKTTADFLVDFRGALGDRLDLRLVDARAGGGDNAFTFIGKAAFSAAGQVRYEKTATDTWVFLNTDADKSAEAVLRLKGAGDLLKGWLLL